jgi:hypothetical protein
MNQPALPGCEAAPARRVYRLDPEERRLLEQHRRTQRFLRARRELRKDTLRANLPRSGSGASVTWLYGRLRRVLGDGADFKRREVEELLVELASEGRAGQRDGRWWRLEN